mmetsp:Transcript_23808/g.59566  ORF Transcript_23808/g.59566 Transcript_23808/m.59566 type:complete len:334 (-) Transcript_23808:535-1536(-)
MSSVRASPPSSSAFSFFFSCPFACALSSRRPDRRRSSPSRSLRAFRPPEVPPSLTFFCIWRPSVLRRCRESVLGSVFSGGWLCRLRRSFFAPSMATRASESTWRREWLRCSRFCLLPLSSVCLPLSSSPGSVRLCLVFVLLPADSLPSLFAAFLCLLFLGLPSVGASTSPDPESFKSFELFEFFVSTERVNFFSLAASFGGLWLLLISLTSSRLSLVHTPSPACFPPLSSVPCSSPRGAGGLALCTKRTPGGKGAASLGAIMRTGEIISEPGRRGLPAFSREESSGQGGHLVSFATRGRLELSVGVDSTDLPVFMPRAGMDDDMRTALPACSV